MCFSGVLSEKCKGGRTLRPGGTMSVYLTRAHSSELRLLLHNVIVIMAQNLSGRKTLCCVKYPS